MNTFLQSSMSEKCSFAFSKSFFTPLKASLSCPCMSALINFSGASGNIPPISPKGQG